LGLKLRRARAGSLLSVPGGLMDAALDRIPFEINVALHYTEFVVNLRPASEWFDDHEAIKAVLREGRNWGNKVRG
jgi:hypothetical protein